MTKKRPKCSILTLAQSSPKKLVYVSPGKAELQFEIVKEMVKEHPISLNEFKSPGPDELHPRVIKELAEELSEPVSIIFAKSWKMGEVLEVRGTLIKFADDTKLGGIANTLEDRNKLQSDLERLER